MQQQPAQRAQEHQEEKTDAALCLVSMTFRSVYIKAAFFKVFFLAAQYQQRRIFGTSFDITV